MDSAIDYEKAGFLTDINIDIQNNGEASSLLHKPKGNQVRKLIKLS